MLYIWKASISLEKKVSEKSIFIERSQRTKSHKFMNEIQNRADALAATLSTRISFNSPISLAAQVFSKNLLPALIKPTK